MFVVHKQPLVAGRRCGADQCERDWAKTMLRRGNINTFCPHYRFPHLFPLLCSFLYFLGPLPQGSETTFCGLNGRGDKITGGVGRLSDRLRGLKTFFRPHT